MIILTQLEAIGIDVEIQEFEFSYIRQKMREGDFDMGLGRYSWSDPDILYYAFVIEPTYSGWINPEVTALLEEARYIMDTEKRRETYAQAQKIILENAPYVPLFVRKSYMAAWDYVKGLVVHPLYGSPFFNDVTLEK